MEGWIFAPPTRKAGRPKKYREPTSNAYVPLTRAMIDWLEAEARRRAVDRSDLIRGLMTGANLTQAADAWQERFLIAAGMAHGADAVVHLRQPAFVARLYRAHERAEADTHDDCLHLPTGDAIAGIVWFAQDATPEQLSDIAASLGRHLTSYRARL